MEVGVITKIYVEHFVTYDKTLIRPGRYLNVIIGPNGTGKSTIVCAIVIGLGGKLSIIGRAKEVGDYVKTGHDKAKIEITLQNGDKEVKICRNFNRASFTQWKLNGEPCNQKAIEEVTKKFNIQMDNLCQFLPQEKVQEFSNLSSENLLVETLRSVGDPDLLTTLSKLKQLRVKHNEVEKVLEDKNKHLKFLTEKYESLKDVVGNIKEKKRIKKKVETLSRKRAWMLYEEKRKEFMKAKENRDIWDRKIKKLEKELKPINDNIIKLEDKVNHLKVLDSTQMKGIVEKGTQIKKLMNQVTNVEEEVQEIEETWKQRVEAEARRDQDIQLTNQQIDKIKNDLQHIIDENGTEQSLKEKQESLLREIDVKRRETSELKEQANNLHQTEESMLREIDVKSAEYQRIQNIQHKRMEKLRNKSEDAYKAVLWLRENQNKFTSRVHEPMLLSINVRNPQYAKYLENVIPRNDLVAFVCEDKGDMNLLIRYLRTEQKLRVNILHSNPDRNVNMNPNNPIEQIKQYGFEGYLISLFEAPTTIMKYLVTMYNLNNIPYGSAAVDNNQDNVPSQINLFFSRNRRYHVSHSKYSGAKSTSITDVIGNDTLTVTIDSNALQEISNRLQFLEQQKVTIRNDIMSANGRLHAANKECEKIREIRTKCQQNLSQITTLRTKTQRMEQKLKELEQEKTTPEEIDKMFKKNIQTALYRIIKLYSEVNKLMEQCYKASTFCEIGRLTLKIQSKKLSNAKTEAEDKISQLESDKKMFRQMDKDLLPLKQNAAKLLQEAKESTNGFTSADSEFKEFNTAFSKLPPTLQEVETMLEENKAKLHCMGRDGDGEQVLQTYDKTKAGIENTKSTIVAKTEEYNKQMKKMNEIRDAWFPKVEGLVEQINVNFSQYFSELKCSGELSLVTGQNIYDFDNYGLKIMVKFRDTDSLQELTRTHQSGGERALTTAVYMIALQNLSKVPFRCVDEINQGMDPINERRVFQLLVKITGSSLGSQYFFLTPKLLPGLEYPKSVTVHCVYNGPYVVSHNEFSIKNYCNNIKEILA